MEEYTVSSKKFHEIVQEYSEQDQNFHDVTLASDDNHQIKAHKLVLSAGSLYLRHLLENANHPESFIHLGGVSKYELLAVVEFLYSGKTKIDVEKWDDFKNAATLLNLVGFSDEVKCKDELDHSQNPKEICGKFSDEVLHGGKITLETSGKGSDKNLDSKKVSQLSSGDDLILKGTVKEETIEDYKEATETKDETWETVSEPHDSDTNSTITEMIHDPATNAAAISNSKIKRNNALEDYNKYMERVDRLWECKVCSRSSISKDAMKRHVETHMPESSVKQDCKICGKTLRSSSSFECHMRRIHSGADDRICNICGNSFRAGRNFNNHWIKCKKLSR